MLIRLLQGIATLFVASVVVFALARLTGNPLDVMLSDAATPEEEKALTALLGLDRPLFEQYWIFITRIAQGDFGLSLHFRTPVIESIVDRFPATVKLTCAAALASFLIALPMGVVAAVKRDKWQDVIGKGFAILGQSAPSFWIGILLIQIFAVQLAWLPSCGYGKGIQYWILPALTVGYHSTAGVLRLTRSSMLDVLSTDYVRLARIKGLSERLVIWKHGLRNALIPVVTFSGIIYVRWLTGSVVAETIFAWPGIGRLAYEAVLHRDFPMIQGLLLIFVGLYVIFNLAIDILYCWMDPRIRYVKE